MHFSETCDDALPHLITPVQTTRAGVTDEQVVAAIQQSLADHDLLPAQQLVDSGYVDAENLIASQSTFAVDLWGPTRGNYRWQAQDGTGFDFAIDWDQHVVTCPQGHLSSSWTPVHNAKGKPVVKVRFSQSDGKPCPHRELCTGQTRRSLSLRSPEQMHAFATARQRQHTDAFKEVYRKRVGIEGTHSQAVRRMGLRRSRYLGLKKTHLQHVATAVAINLLRLLAWLDGAPLTQIRRSPFVALMRSVA